MLLIVQYMAQEEKRIPGPGGKSFGAQLTKHEFEKFAKADLSFMVKVESFLAGVMKVYRTERIPGVSEEALARELPALFLRTGKALLLNKENNFEKLNLSKVERKMRDNLKCSDLPPPVVETETAEGEGDRSGKKRKVVADETPSLNFSEEGLVEDCVGKARSQGIVVGAEILRTRTLKGIPRESKGKVVAMDAHLWTMWEKRRSCHR